MSLKLYNIVILPISLPDYKQISLFHSDSNTNTLPSFTMSSFGSELCNSDSRVSAVILDLDGTLLDTERATKDVLKDFLEKYGKVLDKKREDTKRLGMTQKESAVAIVRDYDLPLTPDQFIQEITPMYREKWLYAKALPGADRLIKHLYSHKVPFALASNSLKEYIYAKISSLRGWKDWFAVILGSDQVIEGKPAPYLFEEAAKRMGVDATHCLVIEDSLVGVKAANAAKMKVVAVPSHGEAECSFLADTVLHSLLEFQPELWGLPPFEDWVDRALPIDPIYLSSLYVNGSMSEISENGPLPDQVFGTFFGWAEVGMALTLKVVVNIGWNCCSCTKRKKLLKLWTVEECDSQVFDQQVQLLLVGYIWRLNCKVTNTKELTTVDVNELEELKSIANVSLDLPMFANHSCTPQISEATSALNE